MILYFAVLGLDFYLILYLKNEKLKNVKLNNEKYLPVFIEKYSSIIIGIFHIF